MCRNEGSSKWALTERSSSFTYPSDPLGGSYRSTNSYDQCRSPSMRGRALRLLRGDIRLTEPLDFTYSSPENSQRRSKSDPAGSGALPSSIVSGVSSEDRKVAGPCERPKLSSAEDAGSGIVPGVGSSVDSRLATSPSAYGAGSNLGSSPYARAGSVSSAQGSFLGGMSSYDLPTWCCLYLD